MFKNSIQKSKFYSWIIDYKVVSSFIYKAFKLLLRVVFLKKSFNFN